MKYKFVFGLVVLLATAALGFASGQHEVNVPGKVVSVNNAANGDVTITLSSDGKSYTISVPAAAAAKLNVQVGSRLTVKGLARNDGKKETETSDIRVSSLKEDGVTEIVDLPDSHGSGSSSGGSHRSDSESSSHDSSNHENNSHSGTADD